MRRTLKVMDLKEVVSHNDTTWNKSVLFLAVVTRIGTKDALCDKN
jgi:hypothetical protein